MYVGGAMVGNAVKKSNQYSLVHVHIVVTSYHGYGSEKIDKQLAFIFFANSGPIEQILVSVLMGIAIVFNVEMHVL